MPRGSAACTGGGLWIGTRKLTCPGALLPCRARGCICTCTAYPGARRRRAHVGCCHRTIVCQASLLAHGSGMLTTAPPSTGMGTCARVLLWAADRYAGGSFKRVSHDSADYGWNWKHAEHHGSTYANEANAYRGPFIGWLMYGLLPLFVAAWIILG